jgi:hypothetical protein
MENILVDKKRLFDYFATNIKSSQRFILCINKNKCNNPDCKNFGIYFEDMEICEECGQELTHTKFLCQWNNHSLLFDDNSLKCYAINKHEYIRVYFGLIQSIFLINDEDLGKVDKRIYMVNL